jgi:hypothetical protein
MVFASYFQLSNVLCLLNFVSQGVWEARDIGMPNSRHVRTILAADHDSFQKETTLMLMQFGQFIDHDITHVPVFQFRKWSEYALFVCHVLITYSLISSSEWKWYFLLHSRRQAPIKGLSPSTLLYSRHLAG